MNLDGRDQEDSLDHLDLLVNEALKVNKVH